MNVKREDIKLALATSEYQCMEVMSERGKDWVEFSYLVLEHIQKYTIPQYGDKGCDQVGEWTAEDCIKAVRKYASRFGSNVRDGQEELDILKMAHFAQLAFHKKKGIEFPDVKG